MYLINKNDKLIIDKIYIKHNRVYNIYNLYYSTNYIKCNGISLNIKFKNYVKIGYLYRIIIDDINILNATMKAMHSAVDELGIVPDHLLVDGNRFSPYVSLEGDFSLNTAEQ